MKPHFSQLTPKQQRTFGNGCGAGAVLLNVPDFIFTADCRHHDFNYLRGGTLGDKLKADWDFFRLMFNDARKSNHPVFYSFVSVVYWLGLTILPFSYFMYHYGKWRTIDEILLKDKCRKI